MLNILFNSVTLFSIISLFILLVINFKNYLTMFQQNSYYSKNYWTWIKNNLYKILANYYIIYIGLILFSIFNMKIITIILGIIIIIIYLFILWFKLKLQNLKQRIKIVYTPRIKRLIATFILFFTLINLVTVFIQWHNLTQTLNILLLHLLVFNILLPVIILFVNLINAPIENIIKRHYYLDAKKKIANFEGEVIAISGSYGKTTTKNFIHTILSENEFVYQTPASFNSTMGLTIAIRRDLKNVHDIFLAELGAKKNKDLDDVMELTNPNIGVLSSIGPQHLETFKSLENVINTKFAIVEKMQKNGVCYLNIDNEYIANYKIKNKDVNIITYGVNSSNANYQVKNIEQTTKGSKFDIYYLNEKINKEKFETQVLGNLNLLNICVGVAIAHQKKQPIRKIMLGVKKIKAPEHRLQLKNNDKYIMIDDAYNSNPVGSKEALNVLGAFKGRRIVVTPGMIELGAKQKELNFKFGTYMNTNADYVILVGRKISQDIYEGLKTSNYNLNNVFIVDHINDAFSMLNNLCQADKENYVLFENDLPDVYM